MDATAALLDSLPAHAADLAYDLRKVLGEERLAVGQRWGCALTAAITVRSEPLREAFASDVRSEVPAETLEDARAAAALMAMNNAYYRSAHALGADYEALPAALRMKRVARPASTKADFELFALVASALNGCEVCLRHHEAKGRAAGLTVEQLHDGVRIGSVVRGVATALWDSRGSGKM